MRLFISCSLAAAAFCCAYAAFPVQADDVDPLAESYRLEARNDAAGAARLMRRVADSAPRRYFPRLRHAWLELKAGVYGDAAESYQRAAALSPDAIEPLIGAQQALVAAERWEAAEKVGRDLVAREPKGYLARSRLAWTLYKRKDWKGAADEYAKVLALYPADVDMRMGLGWSLLALGKKVEAAANFREVLAMVPGHAEATAALVQCR
jgi:tetratricopeptide (TPR) repeat protein